MKVLVACEYSGKVRDAFLKRGIDAVSCDLLPTDSPGPHIQGDVVPVLQQSWDLVIAHPPCTRLCNSGVRWLHERNLWTELEDAAQFFRQCLNANAKYIAVENPIPHKYAVSRIGRSYDFTVQPWQFGDPIKKRTCFWVKNLPKLLPTSTMTASEATPSIHFASPGPDRWKLRSTTPDGIADAIAQQWGDYVKDKLNEDSTS